MIYLKILLLFALILMIGLNGLASATDILWVKISQLSQLFPFPFMPPGIIFMINWGGIFIGLLVFTFFLCFSKQRSPKITKKIIILELITIFLNISWLFATWNKYFALSVFLIALLTLAVWAVLLELRKNHETKTVWWWIWGIYFGWLIIATCVIGVSQLFYLYTLEVIYEPVFIYSILWFGLFSSLIWYFITKNLFALLWSLVVLISALTVYLY